MGKLQLRASLFLSILLASSACAFALDPSLDVSQYGHTAWKIREGFTEGTIFSIAQTPDGYLWLGTEFGLVRFDGVQAAPWQPPGGQQLPSSWIKALLVTRDGTLWIGTEKGLASWKEGKLTEYPEVAGQAVTSLLQDAEGTLWFGVRNPGRLCAVRLAKAQCYGAGSFGWSVPALYEDHKGNLWVSAQTGLWRWAPSPPEHFGLPDGPIEARALIESDNSVLVMATGSSGPLASSVTGLSEGLKQLVGGEIRSYSLPEIASQFRPTCLFRSRDGSLWVGTAEGLLHLHQGRADRFSVTDGLSGNFIRSIFEDREGDVWVSTEDGLDRFRELAVRTISENEQGLSTSAVTVLEATLDGSIWILTADGLNRWQNGHVTVYGERNVPGQSRRTAERQSIANASVTEIGNSGLRGSVYSLGQDDRGRLWAGGGEGVFYFDRGRFVQVPDLPGGNISSIAGDGHGKVWISNLGEGLFYSTPEGVVQRIPWGRLGHKQGALALLPDRSHGGLWLGFLDGGMAYLKDGQISSYNVANGLGKGSVNDLQLGVRGAVWAATEGGLSRVKDGLVTTLTSRNGLPCDAVNWVMEDNDRSLWLYMACGLVRIARPELDAWVRDSTRSVQATTFDSSNGVRSRALPGPYGRKVTKSPDGKIWFSPPDGVSIIDPRQVPFNNLPPPVHVQQITADDKKYDASRGLRLPPRVRDLSIDYTALSLVVPEKVLFRYKLEGWDRDWQNVGNRRRAFYTNLSPGHYRFRVTACNDSGVWNEAGTFLDFSIAPAYWQTNWFRALCLGAFAAILWAVYRLRVRVLEERQTVLERHQGEISALNERLMKAQEEERIRIAAELHDGVLQQITSLTIELATATLALPKDSEPKAEVREVEKKLIQVGAEIRQLSHELHPAVMQESGLATALSSYCEEFNTTRGIPISYKADESVDELSPGAALCIYRVAQEALGNVAKHAKAKQVEVRLTRSDNRVCLSVSDDGVGFSTDGSEKSGGLGLINMRERVRQLNGTFEFDSAPGRGTTVKVEVPFRPSS
ncbi:MAG: two-component regulator propeller domain-containing protein [Candidatus Acidiferrales bacterium]